MGVIKEGQCCGKCESYDEDEEECHYCIEWPCVPVSVTIRHVRCNMKPHEGHDCYCFEEKEEVS
jgi:hypothetical protein